MYLALLTLKRINLSKLHQKKHIKIFALLSLLAIRLPEIFNHPGIIKTLPYNLQKKDSIPTVT